MKVLYFIFLILFFGCSTSDKTVMPSGEKGYAISCDGAFVSMNKCYQKAAKLCPDGYEVHEKEKHNSGISKSLMVSCKPKET